MTGDGDSGVADPRLRCVTRPRTGQCVKALVTHCSEASPKLQRPYWLESGGHHVQGQQCPVSLAGHLDLSLDTDCYSILGEKMIKKTLQSSPSKVKAKPSAGTGMLDGRAELPCAVRKVKGCLYPGKIWNLEDCLRGDQQDPGTRRNHSSPSKCRACGLQKRAWPPPAWAG